ncbi:hypothetical protein J31TS6_61160 [Brevibacillus reuszeri]|uniref:hypothetical protein n=1 Tax=Brevibacillus reuszeri TaxID=54915 RepID=UPI001B071A0F|nr:hypothetical protein [Brevibacillus reuszeri]GIO10088.1 hypothetical protein J31TS6_61160 [Brevibacillus reuszeri]
MNILDSAYRVGQQMKSIHVGKTWVELYAQLSESISPETWDMFLKIPSGFMHYYSYPHALKLIEENSTRSDISEFMLHQMQELKSSQQLKLFCELSVELGDNLNEMVKSVLAPHPIPKDFGKIQASPKLSRSIQDLHRSVQRSGIFKSTLKYYDPKNQDYPSLINAFYEQRNAFSSPIDPRIRKLILKIGSNDYQQKMLSAFHFTDLVFDLTRQIVFESHLKRIPIIPSENIIRSVLKNVNGIQPVYLSLDASMLRDINDRSHLIMAQLKGATYFTVITRRRISWGKEIPEGLKISMKGYLYPEYDVDLLEQLVK